MMASVPPKMTGPSSSKDISNKQFVDQHHSKVSFPRIWFYRQICAHATDSVTWPPWPRPSIALAATWLPWPLPLFFAIGGEYFSWSEHFSLSSAPAHRFFPCSKSHEAIRTARWRTMASFTTPFFCSRVRMRTNHLETKCNYYARLLNHRVGRLYM